MGSPRRRMESRDPALRRAAPAPIVCAFARTGR